MGLHVRLIILAALGVGLLYTVHLLAQDYNKIRKPNKGKSFFSRLGKRDAIVYQPLPLDEIKKTYLNWTEILNTDHFYCVQNLICHILSRNENRSHIEETLYNHLKFSASFKNNPNNFESCDGTHNECPYSTDFLLSLITIK